LSETEKAIRHYLKSIEIVHKDVPEYDWPYANLANLLINQADYKQAFNLATEAAQRNPNSARNYYLVAKALTHLDQSERSFRWLRRSIELDPEYPEPRYLLAQLLRKQGKTDEAQEEFARFKELRAKTPAKLR
jgi:tetratricopeptide (TPR) repeat protein